MALTIAQIQNAYVAFFNRPADVAGLQYWSSYAGNSADLLNTFAESAEYKDLYAGMNSTQLVNAVYQNLFGRPAEVAGLTYWVGQLDNGALKIGNIADAINKGAQGTDADIIANKVAAASAFTEALDSTAEIVAYASANDTALNAVKSWLGTVTSDAASVTAAVGAPLTAVLGTVQNNSNANAGQTFTLTTGIDNIVGTAGNDTINASWNTAATKTLGGLDAIDGGAGTDTLNVDDSATASGAVFSTAGVTVKNVEVVKIATTGQLGDKSAPAVLDLSGMTGATSFDLKSQDAGGVDHSVKVANTADLTVTAAAGTVDTVGGKVVSVTAPGVVLVSGDALTNVTVKGAATASDVTNTVNGAGTAGTTLTSVTFDGIATGTATAKGDALNAVTIKNQAVALATTLTNTATAALTVNVDNAGYNTTTKALVNGVAVDASTSANYKTVTVNSTGVNRLELTAADATAIKATGAGNVTLALTAGAALSFDGSAATGDIALSGFAATTTDIKTGAGKDSFTTNQTAKSAFDTGAGNDTVTVGSALAAGTTVKLGAGDDKLLFSAGGSVANSTATATTVVDGGDGSDTLALALVGAANVGVFQNFEVFDVVGMANGSILDLDILAAKNTVTGLTGSGALGGAAVEILNIGAGINFTAVKDMGTINQLTLTQKTAGALTVTLDADSTSTAAYNDTGVDVIAKNATSLKAVFDVNSAKEQTVGAVGTQNDQTIELTGTKATTLEVVSGGTNATNNLTYKIGAAATTADGLLTTATVSGSQALNLDFDTTLIAGGTSNLNKLATVDASALTGNLTFSLADLANGGTVKLGSGTDLITATVTSTASSTAGTSANIEAIQGFSKSTSATNADAIKLADKLDLGAAATIGTEATTSANLDIAKGVVTFVGAGPTTLEQAIGYIDAAATTNGSAVVFEYVGNSYIFQQDSVDGDIVVKLTGVTGVTELGVSGGDLFIV